MLELVACMKQFEEDHTSRLAESTRTSYKLAVRELISFCKKPYEEISTRDIRNWLGDFEKKGYMPSTIGIKINGIKMFFNYCHEEGFVKNNPAVLLPAPKIQKNPPQYLDYSQLTQLRQLVKGKLRERAAVELLYATGVRIQEFVMIKKEDINWPDRMIHIRKGKGKKERMVLFTKECAEHLKEYLQSRQDDDPYLFINQFKRGPLAPRSVRLWFEAFREELDFHLSPHTLRHTLAAHLAMKGMPLVCIQVLLGHDEIRNTMIYARLHKQAQKQLYDEWM
ncbi:tyrosine-type recombinase/integrase [Cytobacillus pseudoceanisediminis]|uniref:tyrosine-type recombinase/integrase n=1 Tax=Cytobacillus pseudoceanisediminis TaxID=3051614 RepID=UPI003C2F0972